MLPAKGETNYDNIMIHTWAKDARAQSLILGRKMNFALPVHIQPLMKSILEA